MVLVGFGHLPGVTQLGRSDKIPPWQRWVLAGTTLERGESTAGSARRWGQPSPGSAWLELPPKIIKPHPSVSAAEGNFIFIFRPLSWPGLLRLGRAGGVCHQGPLKCHLGWLWGGFWPGRVA